MRIEKRITGTVTVWHVNKSYGFIAPDSPNLTRNVFVHFSKVEPSGIGTKIQLTRGQVVGFEMGTDPQGRPCALNVCSIDGAPTVVETPKLPLYTTLDGTFARYNESKGFGFIHVKSPDTEVFFHVNKLVNPYDQGNIAEGVAITFQVMETEHGYEAYRIALVE